MTVIPSAIKTAFGMTDFVATDNITASLPGANTVVAGIDGYFIVVFGYLLVSSGDVEVAFETESGDVISGPYDTAMTGGNIGVPNSDFGHFICKKNEDLVLDLGGPVHVGGHITIGYIRGGL